MTYNSISTIKTISMLKILCIILYVLMLLPTAAHSTDKTKELTILSNLFDAIKYSSFSGRNDTKLHKWSKTIEVFVFGNTDIDKKNLVSAPFIITSDETNLPIKHSITANMFWVLDPDPQAFITNHLYNHFSKILSKQDLDNFLESIGNQKCLALRGYDTKENINFAVGIIRSNQTDHELKVCSYRNFLSAIGFPYEIPIPKNSILSPSSNAYEYTVVDLDMIRLVYLPNVRSGMTYKEFLSSQKDIIGSETFDQLGLTE